MRRGDWDPGESYWPTLGATGQISQLSDRPVRRAKRIPFGFQPPAAPKKPAQRRRKA